jgi:hypothetical protein
MTSGGVDPATAGDPLALARMAASAYADAVRETERFARRLDGTPDPAELAEYANLLAREEAAHAQRRDAFARLGLATPSEEG